MAETTTNINNRTAKNIDFWELKSSPAEVNLKVIDNTIKDIKAELKITNEGDTNQEYIYYYWITPRADGGFADPDTIDGGSASKMIKQGETYTTILTLNVNKVGEYWFKVAVYWGSEVSYASVKFNAVKPPVKPSGGGGGGGAGGITYEQPQIQPQIAPPEIPHRDNTMLYIMAVIIAVSVIIIFFIYRDEKD